MGDVVKIEDGGEIEKFDPERHRLKDKALDFGIEEAKRIKDWPTLEKAVDTKIGEQRKFIAWRHSVIRGTGQPKKNGNSTVTKLSEQQVADLSGIHKMQAQRIETKLSMGDKYRLHLLGAGFRAAMLDDEHNHRAQGTGENEWYTPSKYIELARQVMGDIDLDPATSEIAQETIGARKFFTAADDGLRHQWQGRVWLNPPYAQPLIYQFVEKMVEERAAGRVTAAIMLTHNYTDTSWFHKGAEIVDAICFTRGRIPFLDADGGTCAPTQGQAFFYYGDDVAKFSAVFLEVGFVVAPYHGV